MIRWYPHPGGMQAGSQGLSAAIPLARRYAHAMCCANSRKPSDSATPRLDRARRFRGYRCAQCRVSIMRYVSGGVASLNAASRSRASFPGVSLRSTPRLDRAFRSRGCRFAQRRVSIARYVSGGVAALNAASRSRASFPGVSLRSTPRLDRALRFRGCRFAHPRLPAGTPAGVLGKGEPITPRPWAPRASRAA